MTAICKPKETPLQTFTLSGFHRSSDLIGGGAAAPKSYQTELEASSGREPSAAELNYQAQFLYADWRSKPIGGIRQKSRDPAVLRAVNWQKRQVERAATLSSWESRLDLTKEVSGDPSSAQARDQGFVGASYEAHRIKERQRTRDLQQHLSSHKLGSGEGMMREDLCARASLALNRSTAHVPIHSVADHHPVPALRPRERPVAYPCWTPRTISHCSSHAHRTHACCPCAHARLICLLHVAATTSTPKCMRTRTPNRGLAWAWCRRSTRDASRAPKTCDGRMKRAVPSCTRCRRLMAVGRCFRRAHLWPLASGMKGRHVGEASTSEQAAPMPVAHVGMCIHACRRGRVCCPLVG